VVPEKGDDLYAVLGQALADKLAEKRELPVEDLLRARYDRFRKIGG
ncbi:MAG: acetyl-CoA carboxylase carboxyl transferase subunit alpha, partial [Oscillospiraceae bacterium]|nr:acetyl-CoA carboxylase carboxyl transferase subunit alpha [Oscillospiraceae bacterium]